MSYDPDAYDLSKIAGSNNNEHIYALTAAQEELGRRLGAAIPRRYRDAGVEDPRIKEWVAEYAENPAQARSLLLWGKTGTGKTWAAYGALRAASVAALRPNRAGVYVMQTWRTTTFPDFLANMRPGDTRDHNPEAYLAGLVKTPLLMLDDVGMAKNSEFVEQCVHRLMSGRYDQMRASIYTTNLNKEGLIEALGERIFSRLVEECLVVPINGDDRRMQKG